MTIKQHFNEFSDFTLLLTRVMLGGLISLALFAPWLFDTPLTTHTPNTWTIGEQKPLIVTGHLPLQDAISADETILTGTMLMGLQGETLR